MAQPTKQCIGRLDNEYKQINDEKNPLFDALPSDNILEWYFLIKGIDDYDGGYYLGKILFPPNFPFYPPDFIMLTPNGKFDVNGKICLSNTGYHADQWNPLWTIINFIIGIISIMHEHDTSGIRHKRYDVNDIKTKALESVDFNKTNYYNIWTKFSRFVNKDGSVIKISNTSQIKKKIKQNCNYIKILNKIDKLITNDVVIMNKKIKKILKK